MCTATTRTLQKGTRVEWGKTEYCGPGKGTITLLHLERVTGHIGYYRVTTDHDLTEAVWICDAKPTTRSSHDLW